MCSRKERSGTAWLLTGVWQLTVIGRNMDEGRCLLCFDEEDVNHILLICFEAKHWRMKFLNDKWLCTNKEVPCNKILRFTSNNNKFRQMFR